MHITYTIGAPVGCKLHRSDVNTLGNHNTSHTICLLLTSKTNKAKRVSKQTNKRANNNSGTSRAHRSASSMLANHKTYHTICLLCSKTNNEKNKQITRQRYILFKQQWHYQGAQCTVQTLIRLITTRRLTHFAVSIPKETKQTNLQTSVASEHLIYILMSIERLTCQEPESQVVFPPAIVPQLESLWILTAGQLATQLLCIS